MNVTAVPVECDSVEHWQLAIAMIRATFDRVETARMLEAWPVEVAACRVAKRRGRR